MNLFQIIGNDLNVSLLWELDIPTLQSEDDVIKLEFSMEYSPFNDNDVISDPKHSRSYKCHFDLQNYQVLCLKTFFNF